MIRFESVLIASSLLVIVSIFAIKISDKLGVPSLVVFLLIGMLAGSDGPGGITFDNPFFVQSLGVIALTFILFAGGLDTEWSAVRPVLGRALSLSTVGVLIPALLVGIFASVVLEFSLIEGLLLGAIVSSTDAAAVFMVLRSRNVHLKPPLKPLLEMESGSNDPMAVFLTIGLIRVLTTPGGSLVDLIPMFVTQMAVGGVIGYVMGILMAKIINQIDVQHDGLYPVLTIAFVLFIYGLAASLEGSGFLAVYLAGLMLRKQDFTHRWSLVRFHDGLAWLMQITMFLILGLQVFPSRLVPIMGVGLLISLFLILVARPVGTLISLAFASMTYQEKSLVAWVGLRGAVPVILGTFPLLAGIAKADTIFHVVFFIVLTSVLLQGPFIPLVARWLKVDAPPEGKAKYLLQLEPEERSGGNP
ncbi:MAG: potassium/proton antiporter [Nitrospiraceae bacterium]